MRPRRSATATGAIVALHGTLACGGDHPVAHTRATSDAGAFSDANVDAGNEADADAAGAKTTVQAAIDAAVAQGGTNRVYIRVLPGTYREVVCVPSNAPPITLYSTNADATQTVIVFNNYNGATKAVGTAANRCTPNANATTYGTAGSTTFSAFSSGFQAKNVTFANDVTPATLTAMAGTGTQAVALMTEADQVILENVRVLGHHDTFYVETKNTDTVVRTYMTSSIVVGDVDFIFGGGSLVIDSSQIEFVSDRKLTGQAIAPSTDSRNPYGILVAGSTFLADAHAAAGSMGLGRAWDRLCGADSATYLSSCVAAGHYPNGQAVVRNSVLGSHVAAVPWVPSATTKRPFCNTAWSCAPAADAGDCPANRLNEYQNTGPGSMLPSDSLDGGAATCTTSRPQLADAQAPDNTALKYLSRAGDLTSGLVTDNWNPTAGVGDVNTFRATYTVASH